MESIVYRYGMIYLITNTTNGKVYVGQTTRSLKKRLINHCAHAFAYLSGKYKGKDTPLFRAIRKYGKESFTIELICTCGNKEELDLMEDLYIVLLGGYGKKTGYNIRRGGANGKMSDEVKKTCGHQGRYKATPEARKKMSDAVKKSLAERPRPPVSDSARANMSAAQKRRPPRSEQQREKMKGRFTGDKSTSYRSDISTEEVVKLYQEGYSAPQIGKILSTNSGTILHRLKSEGVIRRSTNRSDLNTEEIICLYESGMNSVQIGDLFSVGSSSIQRRLKKAGVKMRDSNFGRNKQLTPVPRGEESGTKRLTSTQSSGPVGESVAS